MKKCPYCDSELKKMVLHETFILLCVNDRCRFRDEGSRYALDPRGKEIEYKEIDIKGYRGG